MVVLILERNEFALDATVPTKNFADATRWIPAFSYFPVMLAVETMCQGKRNFESEFEFGEEREL